MKKFKPSKQAQFVEIKTARGISVRKADELLFVDRMAKRKAEDREIERRGDERLASLVRK